MMEDLFLLYVLLHRNYVVEITLKGSVVYAAGLWLTTNSTERHSHGGKHVSHNLAG